MLFGDSPTTHL